MKKLFTGIFIAFHTCLLYSHNPANSEFLLCNMDDTWYLRAEFSWSLFNELNSVYPFLIERKATQEEYLDCLKDYIGQRILLKTNECEWILDKLKQLPGTHSHSFSFLISYSAQNNPDKFYVKSSCLSAIYPNAISHFTIIYRNTEYHRVLTNENPEWYLDLEHADHSITSSITENKTSGL